MRIAARPGSTRSRLAAALLLGVTALPVAAAAAPGRCPGVTTTKEGWRRVAVPALGGEPGGLTAYAVLPKTPRVLFATDGEAVGRSTDGGCTWQRVFELSGTPTLEMPFTSTTARIHDVVAGEGRVYLLVNDVSALRVVVSADRGASWDTVEVPVPQNAIGSRPRLVTDATGMYAYLLTRPAETFRFGLGRDDVFYASTDGGASWSPRAVHTADVPPHLNLRDVGVDPLTGTDVYVTTDAGLVVSRDAGETWVTDMRTPLGNFGAVDVTHRPGKPVQVLVAADFEPLVHLHTPSAGWVSINTPQVVTSFVGGRDAGSAAITTQTGTYELDFADLKWLPVHRGRPELSRLSSDLSTNPMLVACECEGDGALWLRPPRRQRDFEPPRGPERPEFPGYDGCAPPGRNTVEPARFARSAVTPSTREVVVEPGKSKTVTYTFRVQPRVLDVYYLLDSGQASYSFSCAAAQGGVWAAQRLARSRNVRVGLGQYRDYPRLGTPRIFGLTCVSGATEEYVYRRTLRVGPVDATFRSTMRRATWDGSCSGDWAGLPALLQTATGSGQDLLPKGSSPYDIEAGMDAGFTDDAYKVVVHVAGQPFDSPERNATYPGPRFAEVIEALGERDIRQIGISIPPPRKKDHDPSDPVPEGPSFPDLVQVAVGTGAIADRAVNCGAQVDAHVGVGDPLVCTFVDDLDDEPGGKPKAPTAPPMGRQIVDLVSALTDVKPMRVTVLPGSDPVGTLSSTAPRYRDNLVEQRLTYTVTYKCKESEYGEVKQVHLGGQVERELVATATTTVRCGAPPAPVRRKPFDFLPLPGLVVPVAAPAAPNLPPQNLAPNTAPQPNGNPQQLPNAAGGFAVGTEEQPRLAYANAVDPDAIRAQEELAMSARPRRAPYDVPSWVFFQLAGAMSCAAGAYGVRRSRTATARVRTQRF